MFLPTTIKEMDKLGWKNLDVILVSGDSYIDSPFIGISVIGKHLVEKGFRVGVIAQPDINSEKDIIRLGEPLLFWGVTSGSVDSMVANYTATKKRRKRDDYTPGGINDKRPDRSLIVYTGLIRRFFKNTVPVVLGGIEASLRRVSHYDFWSNKVRRSVLFDAKADVLIYGMGERAVLNLAENLRDGENYKNINGICYTSKDLKNITDNFVNIPSFEEVDSSKSSFTKMFNIFYENCDPITASGLIQKHDKRYLIQNPPSEYLLQTELDEIYGYKYELELHPYYKKMGDVRALDTIKFSITTHRGCYGECNFCAISVHQGRTVRYRSEKSILEEARNLSAIKDFKGNIMDAGGPTANMYGFECKKKLEKGVCKDKRCLFPEVCKTLKPDHSKQISLIKKMEKIKGVKRVFIASGIRYDLILKDGISGDKYLKKIVSDNISGQMKIAPEHTEKNILKMMGKPDQDEIVKFKKMFDKHSKDIGKKQFLTYYLIAAHPGCREKDMSNLKNFMNKELKINPEQVQVFTPTPSTYSTHMYYTGKDMSGNNIFVERDIKRKEKQKNIITENSFSRKKNQKNPKKNR
ncbi:MAG: YgiQ family radical SAM protein [Deltaproteobacteria bacterium]|nr:YgiQ family radical SAM protein [Deltaproteobacteria bacterium]